jgi:hypothetical protein
MAEDHFHHSVPNSHRNVAFGRFRLRDGRVLADYEFKNLWWVLDGVTIGYGDLDRSDIEHIQYQLNEGEVFIGWNEHHGTDFQQVKEPMVRITKNNITYPHKDAHAS